MAGDGVQQVVALLGGAAALQATPTSPLDAHDMLLKGMPGEALRHLVATSSILRRPAVLEQAVGMSLRTYQRRKESPAARLNAEQSGRTWKFAELLARATSVFGTQADAEHWFEQPAMGLNQRRPIDLLGTPAGVDVLETFLSRMENGVYT